MRAERGIPYGAGPVMRVVDVRRRLAVSADVVWAVARDFYASRHPLLTTIEEESRGVRRFTVVGEDTVYRERLCYFSESDRVLVYRHLEGIRDVVGYEARFAVVADGDGCVVSWSAEVEALEPRLSEILKGTRFVFEAGVEALERSGAHHDRQAQNSPLPPVGRARVGVTQNSDLEKNSYFILKASATPTPTLPTGGREKNSKIALTVLGDPSNTLCLFLHGIGGGRRNWLRQLPIAAEFMKSAAMDLRGYGDSELGPTASTVDDYCEDILFCMRVFQVKRVVLSGLSYGSWIATSFAMRYPEKLAGLVLAGGCTGMSEASLEERERFRQVREGKSPRDLAPAVVDVIASPHASAEVREELLQSMAAIPVATYRDALRCFTNPQERFDFSKLTMPVLFVTGEHDRLATPDEIRGVSQRVLKQAPCPDVRFEVIAGAGHVCNVEQPEAFNVLLHEFLSGLAV